MSMDIDALQELPEQEPVLADFCCPIPMVTTFATCLGCSFTR